MLCTRMTTLAFLLWIYLPFFCLNLISGRLCNSNTFRNILMILGRNVEQDETCSLQKMTTLLGLGDICFFVVFFSKITFSSYLCCLSKRNLIWS